MWTRPFVFLSSLPMGPLFFLTLGRVGDTSIWLQEKGGRRFRRRKNHIKPVLFEHLGDFSFSSVYRSHFSFAWCRGCCTTTAATTVSRYQDKSEKKYEKWSLLLRGKTCQEEKIVAARGQKHKNTWLLMLCMISNSTFGDFFLGKK